MAESGWLSSWASAEAISPSAVSREMCTSSDCSSWSRASTSWRSVRSRMNPVKKRALSDFISPTASSIGKIEPSLRAPTTTRPVPMIRFSPVRKYRSRYLSLKHIRLQLARSKEFPAGSARHGYDIVAPVDKHGHIDLEAWRKDREACRVRRFWEHEEDALGHLVHKPGGTEHARWAFEYG